MRRTGLLTNLTARSWSCAWRRRKAYPFFGSSGTTPSRWPRRPCPRRTAAGTASNRARSGRAPSRTALAARDGRLRSGLGAGTSTEPRLCTPEGSELQNASGLPRSVWLRRSYFWTCCAAVSSWRSRTWPRRTSRGGGCPWLEELPGNIVSREAWLGFDRWSYRRACCRRLRCRISDCLEGTGSGNLNDLDHTLRTKSVMWWSKNWQVRKIGELQLGTWGKFKELTIEKRRRTSTWNLIFAQSSFSSVLQHSLPYFQTNLKYKVIFRVYQTDKLKYYSLANWLHICLSKGAALKTFRPTSQILEPPLLITTDKSARNSTPPLTYLVILRVLDVLVVLVLVLKVLRRERVHVRLRGWLD